MSLDSSWKTVSKDYKIVDVIGQGSGGQVVKAMNRQSKTVVAVKRIECGFDNLQYMKYILREISIMRQLSSIKDNTYTPMLYDILIPEKALNDIAQMKCLFVVMEYISVDLKSTLEGDGGIKWQSKDIKQILYNMLCTINFIHQCNVMHRDIKPANILIQEDCSIKFCDFGLSRTILSPEDIGDDNVTDIADLQKKMGSLMQKMYTKPDTIQGKKAPQMNFSSGKFDPNELTKNGSLKIVFPSKEDDDEESKENGGNSKQKGGEFSAHMVPRWYRPPEIILGNSHYDNKIDIWGLGCIFAETAYMIQNLAEKDVNNRYLFQGTSCYPLSPKEKKKNGDQTQISKNDQLIKILQILGPQKDDSLEFLDENALDYVRQIQDQFKQKDSLKKKFQDLDSGLVEVMENMIQFCPKKRFTAIECLQGKVFDDIRDQKKEQQATPKIVIVKEFTELEEAVKILCDEITELRNYWNNQE